VDASATQVALPKVSRQATAGDLFRTALGSAVERLIRNSATLRVDRNPEALHRARVAVRKLRSHLRTFEPILEVHWSRSLRARLDGVGRRLGVARDADVMLAKIAADATRIGKDASPIISTLERERDAAYASVLALLHDRRYIALLDDVVAAANRPLLRPGASCCARSMLDEILRPVWRRLRKAVRRRSRTAVDDDLHRIRIKAKDVRYAAEALEGVAGRGMRRLARAAERLQTLLGDQHDAVSACALLAKMRTQADGAVLAGELIALERRAAEKGRRRWKRCWRKAAKAHDSIHT